MVVLSTCLYFSKNCKTSRTEWTLVVEAGGWLWNIQTIPEGFVEFCEFYLGDNGLELREYWEMLACHRVCPMHIPLSGYSMCVNLSDFRTFRGQEHLWRFVLLEEQMRHQWTTKCPEMSCGDRTRTYDPRSASNS